MGEVQHELIRAALQYHHLPQLCIEFFNNIYRDAVISGASNVEWTDFIRVEKGVWQGSVNSKKNEEAKIKTSKKLATHNKQPEGQTTRETRVGLPTFD